MTTLLIAGALAMVLSAVLVRQIRTYALRWAILDLPNDRSSHAVPTPRGGGAGLIASLLSVFVVALWMFGVGSTILFYPIGGMAAVALLGWMDDRRTVGVGARLAAHVLAALTLLPLVTPELFPGSVRWIAPAWWIFWTVSSINVVNFMDGIDGLVASQFLLFGLHLLLLSSAHGGHSASELLGIATAGASAGFLLLNWAPARIFLGDAGSGALGFTAAFGGALLMRERGLGFLPSFLPLYPMFLDATVTLVRRFLRRERITEAHRSHLYQRLGNGSWGHARTTLAYGAAAALGIATATAHRSPVWYYVLTLYIVVILVAGVILDRVAPAPSPARR